MAETQSGQSDKESNTKSLLNEEQGLFCPGCKEAYSWIQEDCVPTSLTCGHSLCYKCVKSQWCNPDSSDAAVLCVTCSSHVGIYTLRCPQVNLAQNAEEYQDLVTSSATDQAQLRETTCPGVHPFQPEISVLEDTKSSSSDLLQNHFQTGEQKHQQTAPDGSGDKSISSLVSSPSQSSDKILSQDDTWRLLQRDEGFIRDWIVANIPDHIIFKMVGASSLDSASVPLPTSMVDAISSVTDGGGGAAHLFPQPSSTTASSLSITDSGLITSSERGKSLPSMSSFLGDSSALSCSGRQLWQLILNRAAQDKNLRSGQQQEDCISQCLSSLSQLTAAAAQKAPSKGQLEKEKLFGGMATADEAAGSILQDKPLMDYSLQGCLQQQMHTQGMGCLASKEDTPAGQQSSGRPGRNHKDQPWLEDWADGNINTLASDPSEGKLYSCQSNHAQCTNSGTQTWTSTIHSQTVDDVPKPVKNLTGYSVPNSMTNKNTRMHFWQGEYGAGTWTGMQCETYPCAYYSHRTCCATPRASSPAALEQQRQGETFCPYPSFNIPPRHHPYLMQENTVRYFPLRRGRPRRYMSETDGYYCMSPSPFLRARSSRMWRGRGSFNVRRMKPPISPSLPSAMDCQWFSEACAPSLSHVNTHLTAPQLQMVQVVRQKNDHIHDSEQAITPHESVSASASVSTESPSTVMEQEEWEQAGKTTAEAEVALMKMREMPSGPCVEDIYVVPPVWLCNNTHQNIIMDCSDSQPLQTGQSSSGPSDEKENEAARGLLAEPPENIMEAERGLVKTIVSELSEIAAPEHSTSLVEVLESQEMQTDDRCNGLSSSHQYIESDFHPVGVMTSVPARSIKRENFATSGSDSQERIALPSSVQEGTAPTCGQLDMGKEKFEMPGMQADQNDQISLNKDDMDEVSTSDNKSDEKNVLETALGQTGSHAELDVSSTTNSVTVDMCEDLPMQPSFFSPSYSRCPEKNDWLSLTGEEPIQASITSSSRGLSETVGKNLAGLFNRWAGDSCLQNTLLPNKLPGKSNHFQAGPKITSFSTFPSAGTTFVPQLATCHPYLRPSANVGKRAVNQGPATFLSSMADCQSFQASHATAPSHFMDSQHQHVSEHQLQNLYFVPSERGGVFQKQEDGMPPCVISAAYPPYSIHGSRRYACPSQADWSEHHHSLHTSKVQQKRRNDTIARDAPFQDLYFPSKGGLTSQTDEKNMMYPSDEQDAAFKASHVEMEPQQKGQSLQQQQLEHPDQEELSAEASNYSIQTVLQEFADLGCATGNAAVCSLLQQLMMLDVAQHGAIEKGCQSLIADKSQKVDMNRFFGCILNLSQAVVRCGQTLSLWSQPPAEETDCSTAHHMISCLNRLFETGVERLSEMVLLYCDGLQSLEKCSLASENTQQKLQEHREDNPKDPSQHQPSSCLQDQLCCKDGPASTVLEQEYGCQQEDLQTNIDQEGNECPDQEKVFISFIPETLTPHKDEIFSQEDVHGQEDLSIVLSSSQEGSETCSPLQQSGVSFTFPVLSNTSSPSITFVNHSPKQNEAVETPTAYIAFQHAQGGKQVCLDAEGFPDTADLPAMFTVAEEDCEASIQCPEEEVVSESAVLESETVEVVTEVIVNPDIDSEPPVLLRQEESICVHREESKCKEPPVLQPLEQGREQLMENGRKQDCKTSLKDKQPKNIETDSKNTLSVAGGDLSITNAPAAKEDKENVRCLRSQTAKSELNNSLSKKGFQKNKKGGTQRKSTNVQDQS